MIGYSPATRGFYDSVIHTAMPYDVVEITTEQRAALLEGQSQGMVIGVDDEGFPVLIMPPEPTRAELEGNAWDAIKAERDRRTQSGGYLASGNWFHSDLFSRSQQIGLVMMGASIPAGLKWKTMEGTFVAMTPALAAAVFAAAAAHDQAIFAAAEVHYAAMLASSDPAVYDITAGWPAVYGE
jgi:hypothetical protein